MSAVTAEAPPTRGASGTAETGTTRRTLLATLRSCSAGTVVTYVVNLLMLPFVLHRVGPQVYGAWATVASVLAVGGLADTGIRTEIARRVGVATGEADARALQRSVRDGVSLLAILAAATLVVGLLASPGIADFAFPHGVPGHSTAQLTWLIRACFGLLALSLVGNGYFGVLRGIQRSDVEANAWTVSTLIGAAAMVAGLIAGWSLWALFASTLAQLISQFIWEWAGTRRLVPGLRLRIGRVARSVAAGYLALSALAWLSQITDVIDFQWDKVILSHFVSSSAVTAFQVATTLVLQGKTLALLPLSPLLVAVAELSGRDQARLDRLYRLLTSATMTVGSTIASAMFVFAPSFIALWLGTGLSAAGPAARLFAVAVALNIIGAPLACRALGEKWHRTVAASACANMVLNGAISLALTITIGLNGALIGSIAGNLAGLVTLVVLLRRRLAGAWTWPSLRPIGIASGLAAAMIGTGLDAQGSWPRLLVAAALFVVVVGATCAMAERPVRTLALSAISFLGGDQE